MMLSNQEYKSFKNLWNSTFKGTKVPCVKVLTRDRKWRIDEMIRKYGKKTVTRVIREIPESSSFLMGNYGFNFVVTLDWLITSNNFKHVMKGEFDDE